mmetsp:Transcript_6982/g.10693  ORF Transcript_6982/g.10693 Transcript_6982/m.10693 type:complete len:205 (+) Transcript_6982:1665-2279(+)
MKAHHSTDEKSPITFSPKILNAINGIVGGVGCIIAVECGRRRLLFVPVITPPTATAGNGTFLLATVNTQRISPVMAFEDEVEMNRHDSANVIPPTSRPLIERMISPGCNTFLSVFGCDANLALVASTTLRTPKVSLFLRGFFSVVVVVAAVVATPALVAVGSATATLFGTSTRATNTLLLSYRNVTPNESFASFFITHTLPLTN